MKRLNGNVTIITGGGKGIGFGLAQAFAEEGSNLVITGRTESRLLDAKKRLEDQYGIQVLPIVADGADEAAIKNVVSKTIEKFGKINTLINNAQVSKSGTPLVQHTKEDFDLLEQALSITDTILVWNKCDLPPHPIPFLTLSPEQEARLTEVELSAKTGAGMEELDTALARLSPLEKGGTYGELLTNQRQEEAARRALTSVVRAREALEMGVTPDALLTDVEEALGALGELTGQAVREDITDRIFSKFCVGK